MDIVLNITIKFALKIAKFLNRHLLSPKSGSSSLSGSLSESLSHWVPVPAARAQGLGRRPPGLPKSQTLSESRMPRPWQSETQTERKQSSSLALHSLLLPLGRRPSAARSRRPLLPVRGRCCGPDTGTVVLRALPGTNLKNSQGSYDHASHD